MQSKFDHPAPAIVLGLCVHGLAVVRALAAKGVHVIALEKDLSLPGAKTRFADIRYYSDINGVGLVDALEHLHGEIASPDIRPIIFAINDNMVKTLAQYWGRLSDKYVLAWHAQRDVVVKLMNKVNIEERCVQQGLLYPATKLLASVAECKSEIEGIAFPIIVKPAKPLSKFKVRLIENFAALEALVNEYTSELPFLLQRWVSGSDTSIVFGALLLDQGKICARFEGQKLRSYPAALGQTTVAISKPSDEVFELTKRFFDGLDLSGPVSLEFKRDENNAYWVIEPTVGRTDYWVDLCVVNGVDLPCLEYLVATEQALPTTMQMDQCVWYDTSVDPFAYFREKSVHAQETANRFSRFAYFQSNDLKPFFAGLAAFVSKTWRRITSRFLKSMGY